MIHGRLVVLALLGCATAACTRTAERRVTAWFEIRDQHPTIEIPHVFASGPHVVSYWMESRGHWASVQQTSRNHLASVWRIDGDAAVLVAGVTDPWIYRRDGDPNQPVKLPCSSYDVSVSANGTRISCVQCRVPGPNRPNCWGSDVRVFRSDGSVAAHYTSDLPRQIEGSGEMSSRGIGFLDDGTPLVVARYPIPPRYFDDHCVLIAVDASGGRVLADVPKMKNCEEPESWEAQMITNARFDFQDPTPPRHY